MYDKLEGLGMTHQQASGWIAQQITNQGLIYFRQRNLLDVGGDLPVLLGLGV